MVDPIVKKLMDEGHSKRMAYRITRKEREHIKQNQDFDYEANTPKGEWV